MRAADRAAGAALLALGIAFVAGALRNYAYWGENGPGPAFLPVWLGIVMALLATLLLVGSIRREDPGEPWLPRGDGLRRLALVLAVTAAFVALLNILGMVVGTVLFLIVLVRRLDKHPWPTVLGVAFGVAALNALVFAYWLRVPLPVGVFGI